MDERKGPAELSDGTMETPAANGSLAAAHLQHGSTTSLSSEGISRQLIPSGAPGSSTDGDNASARDDTQRPASVSRAGALLPGVSLEEVVQDSPYLDLSSPMTAYEWFKAVALAPWALFRFLLSISGLVLVWAVTRVGLPSCVQLLLLLVIGVKPNVPCSPWRLRLLRPWLQFWTGLFLQLGLSFWDVRVKGWEHYREAQEARAICVFNHVSYVDAIMLTHFFTLSGVAKASVASIPFIGAIAVALQFLFVQRRGSADKTNKHTQGAGKTVEKIGERASDGRFPLLMIAPEGTTKSGHCLLRFSTGAFVPGRPVLPMLFKYRYKHFNVGWGIVNVYWHVYRLMTQFINHCEVVLLPVYYPSEEEARNPQLYAANVRALMARELGASVSEHGIEHNSALKKYHVHVNMTGTKVIMAS